MVIVITLSLCSRFVHGLIDGQDRSSECIAAGSTGKFGFHIHFSISEAVDKLVTCEWAGTYFEERIKQFLLTCKAMFTTLLTAGSNAHDLIFCSSQPTWSYSAAIIVLKLLTVSRTIMFHRYMDIMSHY